MAGVLLTYSSVDIFFGFRLRGIGKQQIGDERLQIPLPLTSYILLDYLLGYVCIGSVIHQEIRSLVYSSVGDTKDIPVLVWGRGISYRHPSF